MKKTIIKQELPFYPVSQFYGKIFGEKIYKIPVSVVDDCPNRRGLKGMQTCSFCDQWGSAAYSESASLDLKSQIEKLKPMLAKKFNTSSFLVYFQAYTSTFSAIRKLESHFNQCLEYDFVKGFVVGTRPDCLSPGLFDLWTRVHQKSFVSIELGVQSFFDDQLDFLRRGHTAQDSLKAIAQIRSRTPVDLGIHLIFGLPNETSEHILETAKIVSSLPVNHVKLHNLHVLKHTHLEELYKQGKFIPIEKEPYAEKVALFLAHLRPDIAVQRLAAYAPREVECIAPMWTADKMATHQFLVDYLIQNKVHQGQAYRGESLASL